MTIAIRIYLFISLFTVLNIYSLIYLKCRYSDMTVFILTVCYWQTFSIPCNTSLSSL